MTGRPTPFYSDKARKREVELEARCKRLGVALTFIRVTASGHVYYTITVGNAVSQPFRPHEVDTWLDGRESLLGTLRATYNTFAECIGHKAFADFLADNRAIIEATKVLKP